MPSYLGGFKMASCPLKRDVFCFFFIPNLIKTNLRGTKNGTEICYRILDCREIKKVTITSQRFVSEDPNNANMK